MDTKDAEFMGYKESQLRNCAEIRSDSIKVGGHYNPLIQETHQHIGVERISMSLISLKSMEII